MEGEREEGTEREGRGRIITFCVRRSRGEMYSGHGRLYVCVSVCPLLHSRTTACMTAKLTADMHFERDHLLFGMNENKIDTRH